MPSLYLKQIPETNYQNYISGLEALNIKTNLYNPIDWHRLGILYSHNPNESLKTFSENNILGNTGILEQKILIVNKISFIAEPTRAIIDLIYSIINGVNIEQNLEMLKGDIYNYFPSKKDRNNIASLFIKLIEGTNNQHLIRFFKQEMPKEFFKFKYEGVNYEYTE